MKGMGSINHRYDIAETSDQVSTNFLFIGGVGNKEGWFDFTAFDPGKLYDCIIVSRKCLNLIYEA